MSSKHKRDAIKSGLRFRDGKYITVEEANAAKFVSMAEYVESLSPTAKVICKVCGKVILRENVISHIESCWGIENPDLNKLSINPPSSAYENYRNSGKQDHISEVSLKEESSNEKTS